MMRSKPKVLVFASGTKDGGGSGFENLVQTSRDSVMRAEIVGVVSNHANGGVKEKADRLMVPFIHFPAPWSAERYQEIAGESGADWFALSGWLKLVCGLDLNTRFSSQTVFNIHPGILPRFGGPGLFGHHVHQAVLDAYRRREVDHSGISMHFVTEGYDEGPVFFRRRVPIRDNDTVESLAKRVNLMEHFYQPTITDLVAHEYIRWDGRDVSSLRIPEIPEMDMYV